MVDVDKIFSELRKMSRKSVSEKLKFLKKATNIWQFFDREKEKNRFYYRPNDPEDIKGLTLGIDMNLHEDGCSFQFNGRYLENTYSISFNKSELFEVFMNYEQIHKEIFLKSANSPNHKAPTLKKNIQDKGMSM